MVTAVTAIVAIRQTNSQIDLSNKQHLFDIRVENYLIAKGLVELYKEQHNQWMAKNRNDVFHFMDLQFLWMTNNTYLEEITEAIKKPLNNPYHKEFLKKLECIRTVSTKIRFSFSGKSAEYLAEFIYAYQEVLFSMYQYQITWKEMEEYCHKFGIQMDEAQVIIGEEKQRIKMWDTLDVLDNWFSKLEMNNCMLDLEKQIKLNMK